MKKVTTPNSKKLVSYECRDENTKNVWMFTYLDDVLVFTIL
jgi:hypothetical protein